jgi:hypothetical protein
MAGRGVRARVPWMDDDWRIVAQGRLERAEAAAAARTSKYSVSLTQGGALSLVLAGFALVRIAWQLREGKPLELPLVAVCVLGVVGFGLASWRERRPQDASPTTLYDLNSESIKICVDGHTRVIEWRSLQTFDLRPQGVWLYGAQALDTAFIPRRFMSESDWQLLRDFLSARLQPVRAERLAANRQLRLLAWLVALGLGLLAYRLLR